MVTGTTVSADVVTVTASDTAMLTSLPAAAPLAETVSWIGNELAPLDELAQPAAALTVKTSPVALLTVPAIAPVADRMTLAGGVIFTPAFGTKPTVYVLVVVGAGNAWMVTFTAAAGPVSGLHVTVAVKAVVAVADA